MPKLFLSSVFNWGEPLKGETGFFPFVGSPVEIDLLVGERVFAPFHKDEIDKNGRKYRIPAEVIRKMVKDGKFDGLPIFIYDIDKPDHGFGRRKIIGVTRGARVVEDERGVVARASGIVWDEEVPSEFKLLKERQNELGASAELLINRLNEKDGIYEIEDVVPKGALLLARKNAAIKETALYCSDTEAEYLLDECVGDNLSGGKKEKEDNKLQAESTTKGGKKMDFCENCKPLVDAAIKNAVDTTLSNLEQYAQQIALTEGKQKEENELKAQLADWQAKAKKLEETLENLRLLHNVNTEFEKRKHLYSEDKHEAVKSVLLKTFKGQAAPQDVLALTEWVQPTPSAPLAQTVDDKEQCGQQEEGSSEPLLKIAGADGSKTVDYKKIDALFMKKGILKPFEIEGR